MKFESSALGVLRGRVLNKSAIAKALKLLYVWEILGEVVKKGKFRAQIKEVLIP